MDPAEYETMARLEDTYWWYRALRRLVSEALCAELGGGRLRILDDGCGTGGGMAALARAFPGSLVVGADLVTLAVRYAAKRMPGVVVRASANQLPFASGTFDAVVIADVLNVAEVDEAVALGEAHRVLRHGGVLVANVPAFPWLQGAHDVAVHTVRRYRRRELAELLSVHGFSVRRLTYWNALLLPLVLVVRRLGRRASGRAAAHSDLVPLPPLVNRLMGAAVEVDRWLGARLRVPFGTSVFGLAVKRG